MHKNILIAVGITFLFLGTCITPTIASDNEKKSSIPISSGNTLYVGGSGEGNYSTIQDAIDDASDGDTVFVYDDSSPYEEFINVYRSINLIGEDKDTTIIDGGHNRNVLKVNADWVNISGFTIKNGDDGIIILNSRNNIIYDNHIIKNVRGIYLSISNNINIFNNNISENNYGGIFTEGCYNISIIKNDVNFHRDYGILLSYTGSCNIKNNNILNNKDGIWLISTNNIIELNNIENNSNGLHLQGAHNTLIENNNFIKNNNQTTLFISYEIRYNSNYWDDWIGVKIKLPFFNKLPKIIWYQGSLRPKIDWRPALKPYDIEV